MGLDLAGCHVHLHRHEGSRDCSRVRIEEDARGSETEKKKIESKFEITLTRPAEYFAQQDIRPAAISAKPQSRAADSYVFSAHANPAMTHKHYDRRRVKRASSTE
ncbi:hypothetical protein [Pandoraea pulmonicola]|uniref:hypothetical protein n=1 Tax=Pandoraea pulmonicola TaxID=93221 RepID=UPI0011C05A91|nr:hypothetical protein [Pandoraea pulmonicola]